MCVGGLPMCMSMNQCSAYESQKRVSDLSGTPSTNGCHVVTGN